MDLSVHVIMFCLCYITQYTAYNVRDIHSYTCAVEVVRYSIICMYVVCTVRIHVYRNVDNINQPQRRASYAGPTFPIERIGGAAE